MKRFLAVLMAALLALTAAAQADAAFFYEGPVITFSAPRDAELTMNEMTADSYVQALYSAGSGEVIVSAAFASIEERDVFFDALLGRAVAAAVPVPGYDSLQGHGAMRFTATSEFREGDGALLSQLVQPGVQVVIDLVAVDAARSYLFAAAMPESAYYGEAMNEVVEAQIESLEIFDPDAKIMILPDTEDAAAYNLTGELLLDAEAEPFLLYALDAIRDVRLSTVAMDGDGGIAPDAPLAAWSAMDFGDAIRIRAWLPDVLPGFAVTFADLSGDETTLYVTMSGLDGTLLLTDG